MKQLDEIRGRLEAVENLATISRGMVTVYQSQRDVARLLNAVQGVLDLHKPSRVNHEKYNSDGTLISYTVTHDGPCEACSSPEVSSRHCEDCERGVCEGVSVGSRSPWPCPTVEALTSALDPS